MQIMGAHELHQTPNAQRRIKRVVRFKVRCERGMESAILFAWEVAKLLEMSNSKFLRTVADEIPCERKGGVRLYKRGDVNKWLSGTLTRRTE